MKYKYRLFILTEEMFKHLSSGFSQKSWKDKLEECKSNFRETCGPMEVKVEAELATWHEDSWIRDWGLGYAHRVWRMEASLKSHLLHTTFYKTKYTVLRNEHGPKMFLLFSHLIDEKNSSFLTYLKRWWKVVLVFSKEYAKWSKISGIMIGWSWKIKFGKIHFLSKC